MTYRELGKARGISAASAARLAFRKGWPGKRWSCQGGGATRGGSPYDARAGTGDAAAGEAPGRGAVGRGARGARNQRSGTSLTRWV